MEYTVRICCLTEQFFHAYPADRYPEILHKDLRQYTCLVISLYPDVHICIPFRSSITHKNAYLFKTTARSRSTRSGLDYSKVVLIRNTLYLDTSDTITVDNDEYREMILHREQIVSEIHTYLLRYAAHISGKKCLHPQEYTRKYGFSTLPYFQDILTQMLSRHPAAESPTTRKSEP